MMHPAKIGTDPQHPRAIEATEECAKTISHFSGIDAETVRSWCKADSYFNAHAAVACGLATGYDFDSPALCAPVIDSEYQPRVPVRERWTTSCV
jgi:hypothetical protein